MLFKVPKRTVGEAVQNMAQISQKSNEEAEEYE